MSSLDDYLKKHYLNAEQFALLCGIPIEVLGSLVEAKLIPQASYVVTSESTLKSYVFGELDAPNSISGSYFHPKNRPWVDRAIAHSDASTLKEEFISNFIAALADLNRSTWRLPDSFTDSGSPIPAGLAARTEDAWKYFLNGTFGLCVANPSTEASIARKEVLQEKLSALTRNGTDTSCVNIKLGDLLELIDQYAQASMPFSPV